MGRALIKPNKKQPTIFTIKVLLICHLNKAPGTAPIDMRNDLFCWKKILTYYLAKNEPKAIANMPKENDKVNDFKNLKNL